MPAEPQPGTSRSQPIDAPRSGERRDTLAIRWFTPRGRATRQELLEDLRFDDGANLPRVLAELRREGLREGTLDLRGIDLRGEDLAAARLPGADLTGARLDGCDLTRCDLSGATLDRATLTGARLRGVLLTGARLRDADLQRADLLEANLEGADLDGARLAGATLHRARICGAALHRADLGGVDLSTALRERAGQAPVTRRPPIGTPPASEPRRKTDTRRVAPLAPRPVEPAGQLDARGGGSARVGSAGGGVAMGRIIAHETVRMARAELGQRTHDDFDAALGELLSLRGKAERITIVVGGVERVLFLDEGQARVTVRVG